MKLAIGLSVLFLIGGCGGDDDGAADDDGAPTPDAAESNPVAVVDCATATIAETIVTDGLAYSPNAVTISAGEVVEIHPGATHDALSNDGYFHVGLGEDVCLRFDEVGSYVFHCVPHGFTGTITVQ